MTTQTQKPLILTVDEFLDASFSKNLIKPALILAYHTIPEVEALIDGSDLDGSYAFADVEELDKKLYDRIRIKLTLGDEQNVIIETYLADEE